MNATATGHGPPFTTAMRDQELDARREAARSMGKDLDVALRKLGHNDEGGTRKLAASRARPSCASWLLRVCRFVSNPGGAEHAKVRTDEAYTSATPVGNATTTTNKLGSVFGLRVSASEKLASAADTMRARIGELEHRSEWDRAESVRLAKLGQRTAALRLLKRAKATEAIIQSNSNALLAVEQQSDMLAQSQVQKKLSAALASSNKLMKGGARLVASTERAIDDAQDARDVASDVEHAVSDFANASVGDIDDDDVARELDELLQTSEPTPSVVATVPASGALHAFEPVLPQAPTTRVVQFAATTPSSAASTRDDVRTELCASSV